MADLKHDVGETHLTALAQPVASDLIARKYQGELSPATVRNEMAALEEAGLISRHREATARLSHLEAAPLREATQWLVTYHEYWDESFDRLDALLVSLQRSRSGWMPARDEKETK